MITCMWRGKTPITQNIWQSKLFVYIYIYIYIYIYVCVCVRVCMRARLLLWKVELNVAGFELSSNLFLH